MDWHKLYFGPVSPSEVKEAIKDPDWQKTRLSMKGMSLKDKYATLSKYLAKAKRLGKDKRLTEVCITNYVTALSRGGLIKPSDYR